MAFIVIAAAGASMVLSWVGKTYQQDLGLAIRAIHRRAYRDFSAPQEYESHPMPRVAIDRS